ncbi:MAG: SH3 domain-containing protein [Alphaproteobacteria bacterium]|nr:SH3 domain-containing protein [Alphaproteobacteria bacterium]
MATLTPPPALALAIAAKDAKLRATPSIYGKIVGKLPRDTKVEVVEIKGEWTHVRRTDAPAKGEPAEGWAKSSVLQDPPAPPAKPTKPKKKK